MGRKGALKKGEEKECSKKERKRSAQKGRGKGVLKKGEEKECSKRERKRRQKKGLQNSRILKRMAGWAEIRKF